MKSIILAVFALGLVGSVQAKDVVQPLDEAMTPAEFAEVYKPLRDLARTAMKEKRFGAAFQLEVKAGKATHFSWVRARRFANGAFALARAGRCAEAITWYNKALGVQDKADAKASGGPKWAKARKQCRADIMWGLKESTCAENKKGS